MIFTSGGTEANNLAIRGLLSSGREPGRPRPRRPASSSPHLEHPSITALADELARHRLRKSIASASTATASSASTILPRLLRPETRLVTAMLANNETGVLQPVAELAAICSEHGIPLHTDAAQVVGKLPVNFRALGAATMTIAAHKFHGPLGIGALVVRHGIELAPQLFGGFQQAGLRPGTESVALAVGMLTRTRTVARRTATRAAHG